MGGVMQGKGDGNVIGPDPEEMEDLKWQMALLVSIGLRMQGLSTEFLTDKVNFIVMVGEHNQSAHWREHGEMFKIAQEMLPHLDRAKTLFGEGWDKGLFDAFRQPRS